MKNSPSETSSIQTTKIKGYKKNATNKRSIVIWNHANKILEFNAFFQDGDMVHRPNKIGFCPQTRRIAACHFIKREEKKDSKKTRWKPEKESIPQTCKLIWSWKWSNYSSQQRASIGCHHTIELLSIIPYWLAHSCAVFCG